MVFEMRRSYSSGNALFRMCQSLLIPLIFLSGIIWIVIQEQLDINSKKEPSSQPPLAP